MSEKIDTSVLSKVLEDPTCKILLERSSPEDRKALEAAAAALASSIDAVVSNLRKISSDPEAVRSVRDEILRKRGGRTSD